MIEAGFSYVAPWHKLKFGFYTSKTFDGSKSTDSSFWVGGYVEVPFGGKK